MTEFSTQKETQDVKHRMQLQHEAQNVKSRSVVSNSLQPYGLYSPWNSPGQNTGVDSLSLLQGIFQPGIKPTSLALQADSLPAEPQGKPKNTGGGSLSLLQQIFTGIELGSPALQADSLPTGL